jgi:D-xylonolactonase
MEQIRVIADCGDLCGEGPLWDARGETLYWTDITGRCLHQYLWSTKRHETQQPGREVAGFALLEEGGFVVTNSNGIWLWDGGEKWQLVADSAEGKNCVLNDCVADPAGRLFAGSCFFEPGDHYERGCLFRLDTDGSVHVVDEGILLSNGLGFSPDESTLYYADSAARRIYAYDYRKSDGRVRNRRTLAQVPEEEGIPDGLTVDADGFIWCAHWFGARVVRYRPDGTVERRVHVPALQTSSVTFGGPDFSELFITSAQQRSAESLAPPGYNSSSMLVGGPLFHARTEFRGKEEYRARLAWK